MPAGHQPIRIGADGPLQGHARRVLPGCGSFDEGRNAGRPARGPHHIADVDDAVHVSPRLRCADATRELGLSSPYGANRAAC